MENLENIIEICVAIDIAILGIAYPIIVDKISNIGDKYSSEYLSEVFKRETPHRQVHIPFLGTPSFFKIVLISTIISFIFLIFKFKPWFKTDNWVVNNSADLFVLGLTITLTILFFLWLEKVVLFNGKASSILRHLISRYNKEKNNDIRTYYLKTINEFTYYAVEKQDDHLQKTLLEFYYSIFSSIKRNHDKSLPLDYPDDLYQLIYKLNVLFIDNNNRKLQALEHRAVSGLWLFGESLEHIEISERTYNHLWINLTIATEKSELIKMYWAAASQHFRLRLDYIYPQYTIDSSGLLMNEKLILQRQKERKRFLEFNYALGGLLLYKSEYKTLHYILNYSQSFPPDYVLLPKDMTSIFSIFEDFNNEYKNYPLPIEHKYPFPGLDNYGNSGDVIYWICSYIVLLFVRQFNLRKHRITQNFTGQPNLPDNLAELNNWLSNLDFFEQCLEDILANEELMKELKL